MDYPPEDNYTVCGKGHTHWGPYGAAGALLRHTDPAGQRRYLMMLRSGNVLQPGTWGIPGGAMAPGESPEQAALRETSEEGVPMQGLQNLQRLHTNDHGGWAYHTVGADVPEQFEPEPTEEHDDHGWFTPQEIDELPLHPGFRESWGDLSRQRQASMRVTQSETELCVMLDISDAARKKIHKWVKEQEWPEGTELHEPEKYHITLMYTPDGHHEHKDADWIDHLETAHVRVTGFETFTQDDEGRYPYVLRLDAPEVKEHAAEMQRRAEDHGLEITHFPGGYKPHLTVGYGTEDEVEGEVLPLEFDAGPSFVSPPRKDKEAATEVPEPPHLRRASGKDRCENCKMFIKGKTPDSGDPDGEGACYGFGNWGVYLGEVCDDYAPAPGYHQSSEAEVLDHLSLASVAHNLHYKYEEGITDPASLFHHAHQLLKLIGYEPDDIHTQAALQAWQTMYPDDQVGGGPYTADPKALQAPPTTPTESWGYGTVSSWPSVTWYLDPLRTAAIQTPLYHWTDASNLERWMDPSHTGPGHTYLTEEGNDPSANPDVPASDNPVRITIDPEKLDPQYWDDQYDGWLNNHLYLGPIPQHAIGEIKSFDRPESWELGSTEPTEVNNPQDRWPDWGKRPEDELHHHDVQFGNDV